MGVRCDNEGWMLGEDTVAGLSGVEVLGECEALDFPFPCLTKPGPTRADPAALSIISHNTCKHVSYRPSSLLAIPVPGLLLGWPVPRCRVVCLVPGGRASADIHHRVCPSSAGAAKFALSGCVSTLPSRTRLVFPSPTSSSPSLPAHPSPTHIPPSHLSPESLPSPPIHLTPSDPT